MLSLPRYVTCLVLPYILEEYSNSRLYAICSCVVKAKLLNRQFRGYAKENFRGVRPTNCSSNMAQGITSYMHALRECWYVSVANQFSLTCVQICATTSAARYFWPLGWQCMVLSKQCTIPLRQMSGLMLLQSWYCPALNSQN